MLEGNKFIYNGKEYPLFYAKKLFPEQFHDFYKIKKYNLNTDKLYYYQNVGACFLLTRKRAILADEMGLGKTVQSIFAAKYLMDNKLADRVVIMVMKPLINQWLEELKKFANIDAEIITDFTENGEWLITNYEKCRKPEFKNYLDERTVLILDEATKVKNFNTKTAKELVKNNCEYIFILTATPIQNSPLDLWALVTQLHLNWLGSYWNFINKYAVKEELELKDRTIMQIIDWKNLNEIREIVEPIVLRRKLRQIYKQIPERESYNIEVDLNDNEMRIYNAIKHLIFKVNGRDYQLGLITILRRYLDFPEVLRNTNAIQELIGKGYTSKNLFRIFTEKDLMQIPSKLEALKDIISTQNSNDKIVIFTEYKDVAEKLGKALGSTYIFSGNADEKILTDFKANGRILINTNKGMYGLNLNEANVVINYDMSWNPALLEQRIGRVDRLTQNKRVKVFNLIVSMLNNIEEEIIGTIENKKFYSESIIGS